MSPNVPKTQLVPYLKRGEFTPDHKKRIRFATNAFLRKGVDMMKSTPDELHDALTGLSDTYRDTTLNQIRYIVRSERPELIKDPRFRTQQVSHKLYRIVQATDALAMKHMVEHFCHALATVEERWDPTDRVYINVAAAVVIALCTNLRSAELMRLTVADLVRIKNKEEINIKTKKARPGVLIGAVTPIYDTYYPILLKKCEHEKLGLDDRVVRCSVRSITMHVKEVFVMYGGDRKMSIGIQGVRSLNVSMMLLILKDPNTVATFMRHKQSRTTTRYYNQMLESSRTLTNVVTAHLDPVSVTAAATSDRA